MPDPYEEYYEKRDSSYFNSGMIAGMVLTVVIEGAICIVLHFVFGVI